METCMCRCRKCGGSVILKESGYSVLFTERLHRVFWMQCKRCGNYGPEGTEAEAFYGWIEENKEGNDD